MTYDGSVIFSELRIIVSNNKLQRYMEGVCVCDSVMDLCMSFRNILHKWGIERRGNLCLHIIYVASK
jgi:hypothetical protein